MIVEFVGYENFEGVEDWVDLLNLIELGMYVRYCDSEISVDDES